MPARVVVTSGPDKGQTVEIQARVVRIGGHPGSEIQLQGQADAVATLRYRNGIYTIFNRGDDNLELPGESIAPDGSAAWKAGRSLGLPHNVTLELQVQGDARPAAPSTQVAPAEDDFEAAVVGDEKEESQQTQKSNRNRELIVTALCLVACVWLLADEEQTAETGRSTQAEFQFLISALLNSEHRPQQTETDGPLPPRLEQLKALVARAGREEQVLLDGVREAIQRARVAELRGNPDLAVKRYQAARDLLLVLGAKEQISLPAGSGEAAPDAPQSIYTEINQFVVQRIDALSG